MLTSEPFGITVVITSFKDHGLILKCIDSVLNSQDSNSEIVVVDCMSKDLTRILPERYGDRVNFIQLSNDVGVAEQRNIGFRNSSKNSKYVLFLDNDTEVERNTVELLRDAAKRDPGCSIFQPRIVSYNNREKTLEMGLASNIFGIPKPIRGGKVEPFFASGSGMLVRNDVLLKTGGFDPAFYFGAEELDLVWKARLLGQRIRSVPDSVVYHKTEDRVRKLSADRLYFALRNTIRMQLKNYSCPLNLLVASLFVIRSVVEGIFLSFSSRVLGYFKSNVAYIATYENRFSDLVMKFLSAVFWNLRNMKDTLVQHAAIQSIRIIGDEVILSAMNKNDFIFVSPAYQFSSRRCDGESLS